MWHDDEYFEVAVYWPDSVDPFGGYGGGDRVETLKEAQAKAERLKELGYKNVHIRKVTVKRIQ